ncbi:hypothetical protein MEG1DRAFT_01988 [Photorhabdus temperata subsp. temperata Meg1]|uniref:Uncharacterized protein n=1 Tax=Photorhabdus temperata subsp. temperata Meg1 TaxID=1393735 RepID=A0A081RXA7_PHOTE|nr:hypothetical protein MEG1DRAFT_01988 [Photorhabdus temperata subsp. temperata Meg1]
MTWQPDAPLNAIPVLLVYNEKKVECDLQK